MRWLLVLGVAAALFFGPSVIKGLAVGKALGGVAVVCFFRFVVPMMHRWNYRKYKSIQGDFTVELIEDGVRFCSLNSDSKVTWDTVLKWRQNDKWLLIYPMPRMYHMIPTAVTAQGFDLLSLTDRLRQHVGEPE
jgi:YcxB-like protein